MSKIRRLFVEKKDEYKVESEQLLSDFRESLGRDNLKDLRIVNRYDITNISDQAYQEACRTIFC